MTCLLATPTIARRADSPNPGADSRAMVARMATLRDAVPTVVSLAMAFRWDLDRTFEAAVVGEAAGDLELWDEVRDGPSVSLSPLAASRFGLRMREDHSRGVARFIWLRPGERPRPAKRKRRGDAILLETDVWGDGSPGLASMGEFESPRDPLGDSVGAFLDAIEAVESGRASSEAVEATAGRGAAFAGMGVCWDIRTGQRCPVCEGKRLSRITICARCQRSGVDDLLGVPVPLPAEEPRKSRYRPTGRPPGRPKARRA